MKHNRLQVHRQYSIPDRLRSARAWWDADSDNDTDWTLHFHADYVPSIDCHVSSFAELWLLIDQQHSNWIVQLHNRFNVL